MLSEESKNYALRRQIIGVQLDGEKYSEEA